MYAVSALIHEPPRPSRRPLWRSLASGKHTLTAAATTPETFDECRDWRAGRQARTRQCLRTKKADVPALKALDCYTKLSTHEQTTCSGRIFDGGPPSDIKSIRCYNRRNRHPPMPRLLSVEPRSPQPGFSCSQTFANSTDLRSSCLIVIEHKQP